MERPRAVPTAETLRGPRLFALRIRRPPRQFSAAPDALSPPTSPPVKTDPMPDPAVPSSQPPPIPAAADSQCPECSGAMAQDAVVCISCGFNRATGKRLKTVAQRIARRWDAGNFPLPARLVVLIGLVVVCCIPAFLSGDDPNNLAWRLLIPAAGATLGALG